MINRTTRLRWRRIFRRSRKQVEDMGTQAEEHLERHFFRRLVRLGQIRRFLISWVLLLVILIGGLVVQIRNLGDQYLTLRPSPGGTFVEGILGNFTNANPLYATSSVDSSVSRLVFASLFKFDQNHQLVNDLAEKWTVDDIGTKYIVTLPRDLRWQDGYPLTSSDVVFTYQSIQNPDAKSPLAASWRGITVTAVDAQTIEFVLPNSLSAFPYSMTNGIVPKHLLSGIPASQLRSVSFNTLNPVGAGPFTWQAIEVSGDTPETREQKIALVPNENYHGSQPKLGKFIIRSFHDQQHLVDSFKNRELTGAAGLATTPEVFVKQPSIREYNIPLLSEVMVFLKTSSEILSDVKVRQAITRGTDPAQISNGLDHPVLAARGPLLISQLGYDKSFNQLSYDPVEATKLLDSAGWVMGNNGIREKDGKPLSFTLYSQDNPEYTYVVSTLQKQWKAIGVEALEVLQAESELQTSLTIHSYDSLVYGISLGTDPDVFAYWHSSQASLLSQNHSNFSEYRSVPADRSLEAGRTRSDPTIRAIKYRPFLEAWKNDAPAVALYQPRFLYLSRGEIFGFNPHSMTAGPDRYANVENWMIKQTRVSL